MTKYVALMLISLGGCNPPTTLAEACPETVPGGENITEAEDLQIAHRINCYRRLAKASKARVDPTIQRAVENHRAYIELNRPERNFFAEDAGLEGFTGNTALDRLEAEGYTMPPSTGLLEVFMLINGDAANQIEGAEHIDLWFADPFMRPAFLQPVVNGIGVATARYTYEWPPEVGLPPTDRAGVYYNILYTYTEPAVATIPRIYPRNGQTDAPGSYVHLSMGDPLEFGRTYGYPITFTVGSNETGLKVEQAIFSGPEGSLPFQLFYGADASGGFGLFNSAILVPDAPLTAGATYTALVEITTDQGIRRARTTFTVGQDIRPIDAFLARTAPEDLPQIYRRALPR